MPQIPTPLANRYDMTRFSSMNSPNATANPNIQPLVVPRVSTIELILSVTEASVCPGSKSGSGRSTTVFFDPSESTQCPQTNAWLDACETLKGFESRIA